MISTAFKTSYRILRREKLYAFINIFGLSLAMACALILGLYLLGELTYDRHFEGYEDVYRIETEMNVEGSATSWALSAPTLGLLLKHDFPELIEEVVLFRVITLAIDRVIGIDDLVFPWSTVYFASPNVFKVFPVEAIYGDPETALDEPWTVALSETAAQAYFGDRNPIGETISDSDAGTDYKVTLVYRDLPENTHVKFDVLFTHNNQDFIVDENLASLEQGLNAFWRYYTYLKVKPQNVDALNEGLGSFYSRHLGNQPSTSSLDLNSWMKPLADTHYFSNVRGDMPAGNIYYIYAFFGVGIFILLIATFNYINLSTARSEKRSKEVGMKKILGSGRQNLVTHFLVESLLNSLAAAVLAIVIVALVLDMAPLGSLFGKSIAVSLQDVPILLIAALLLSIVVGLISGLYPAFYLSSWAPLSALVSKTNSSSRNLRFRSSLVFVQFMITISIISSTILMVRQMNFLLDKDLGFKKENQVVILLRGMDVISQIQVIKSELLTNSNILGVTTSDTMFGGTMYSDTPDAQNNEGKFQQIYSRSMQVEQDFLQVMGLELIEGRNFASEVDNNESNIIVNETFVNRMGWDNPIGKQVYRNPGSTVIGVIKDFNYASLHLAIDPILLYTFPGNDTPRAGRAFLTRYLVVTISGDDIRRSVDYIGSVVRRFDPAHSFDFKFLDDSLDQLYQNENRVIGLLTLFAVICIAITCLGLFGLVSYVMEQRARELAIRKILGSSFIQTINIVSSKMAYLLLIGSVFASVLSYLAIDYWLDNFAYRAVIGFSAFILATLLTFSITYMIILLQSARVTLNDPSQMLKYE